VDFANYTVDFVTVTGFREFRFFGRPVRPRSGYRRVGLPYPGNLLPGYPPGNTTGTRVPDRKRK